MLFCIAVGAVQITINNCSRCYVDMLAIVLVSLLLRGNIAWGQIILLSFIGDLIGHWYVGSHLLAVVGLSLFTDKFVNFYRMCGWLPRNLISIFFLAIFYLIIYLIEVATRRVFTSLDSLLIQLLILLPLVQGALNQVIPRLPAEYDFQ